MDILQLIGGLVLILVGANGLTDGASSMAARFKISPLVIGLTVVSFGTSAPELTVSIASALKGNADLAVGNVVGSNIFNALMIVGCTALVAPIIVTRSTLRTEIPLAILAAVVLFICGNHVLLNGDTQNIITRTDGLLMICFFVIFMGYTFAVAKNNDATSSEAIKILPIWRSLLYFVAGLAALVYGGEWFVEGASSIARKMGVSESVIGLTLVAGGTSLPELATSVVAAFKKNPELAIGNAIGSNLFNIFFVLGTAATITPLHCSGITNYDFLTLIFASILLWFFAMFFGKRTITRIEGSILIACYVSYITYLVVAS